MGGYGIEYGIEILIIVFVDDVDVFVVVRLVEGSDYIKIVYDVLVSDVDYKGCFMFIDYVMLNVVVKLVYVYNVLVVVYVMDLLLVEYVVKVGVDGLVYIFGGMCVSDELIV